MVLQRPVESVSRSRHTEKLTEGPYLEQQLESRWMVKLLDRLTFLPRPLLRHLLDIDDHRFTLHAFPD